MLATQFGLFQRITFLLGSPPGAWARLPKMTPISGASSFTERYSSPERHNIRVAASTDPIPERIPAIRLWPAPSRDLLELGDTAGFRR